MSGRKWKRIRRQLKPAERSLDAEKRSMTKPPLLIRAVGIVYRPALSTWWRKWEREHKDKLHHAMKKSAHILEPK